MKTISVVIPVYNVEPYLRRCVDSVLNQSCALHEVILIDDGSTDGSSAICDEYARAQPQLVRVVHQANQGLSAARNRGIAMAEGELLAFVDSDDYIEPDMYQRLLLLMEKTGADMAIGGFWVEKESGERYRLVAQDVEMVWGREDALVEINSFRYLRVAFWNELFRKELFDHLRFPPVLFEDNFLMYQVMANCKKVAYTSHPVYHYIQRFGSISRNNSKVSLIPLDAAQEQLDFFRARFPDIAYAAEAAYSLAHMDVYTQSIRKHLPCDRDLWERLKREGRRYLGSILKNRRMPKLKKLQALAFCFAPPVYKFVISRTEHR